MGWLFLQGTRKTQAETESLSVDFKRDWNLLSCEGMLEILHLPVLEAPHLKDFATKTWNNTYGYSRIQARVALQQLPYPWLPWNSQPVANSAQLGDEELLDLLSAVRALESSHRGLLDPKARRNAYQRSGCLSFRVSLAPSCLRDTDRSAIDHMYHTTEKSLN